MSEIDDVDLFYTNRTREKAETTAIQFGGEVCESIEALVSCEPDTVFVLTRETQRLAVTEELLSHKPKRVMFEKPLVAQNGQANVCGNDFFDACRIIEMAKKSGTETAMIFNYRFLDHILRARRLVKE